MYRNPAIGFIGFGEAGSNIAKGLRSEGLKRLFTFDIRDVRDRAAIHGTTVADTPSALARSCDILISAVTADSALDVASTFCPVLSPGKVFADINSVSPALKQQIGSTIQKSGAAFVEVAVMAPVPPHCHRVPLLINGDGAAQFAETMSAFGMRMEILPGKIGTAAAVKMCRSIVVKGLEALLLECVISASQYDAEDRVFASLNESFPGLDWKKLANYMVGRVVLHGERRAHEMEEVAATLRSIGIDPIMAEATARRQAWSAGLDLKSHFGPDGPEGYQSVLDVINK